MEMSWDGEFVPVNYFSSKSVIQNLEDWMMTLASDYLLEIESARLERRLAAALVPVADPEPEIEDWMLTFAADYMAEIESARLERRLAAALVPVADPEPELKNLMPTHMGLFLQRSTPDKK